MNLYQENKTFKGLSKMIVNDCNVEADSNNDDKNYQKTPIKLGEENLKHQEDIILKQIANTVFAIFKEVKSSKIMSKSDYEAAFNCKVDSDDKNGILITNNFGNRLWIPMNMIINNCYLHINYPNTIEIKIKS